MTAIDMEDAVLRAVLSRRSAPRLIEPAPDRAELLELIQAASTAPDHGKLRPWRLIVVDSSERAALGEVLREAAQPPQGDRAAAAPLRAPLLVSIVFCPHRDHIKIPEWEQLAAVSAMVQTLLLLLHSRGWGAIWRTGGATSALPVLKHLGIDDSEQLLGWVYIGTWPADLTPPPRPPADVSAHVTWSGRGGC